MNRYYAKYKNRFDAYMQGRRAWASFVVAFVKQSPCQDCGETFPPECMDFDHVRGRKFSEIARLASTGQVSRFLKEIEKCDLVCANCHRTRTRNRRKT